MATVKFNLRKTNSSNPETIYLIFRHKNERLVFSTGLKVIPKYWNLKEQSVKNSTNIPDRHHINSYISKLKMEVQQLASRLINQNGTITRKEVKLHLDIFTGKARPEEKTLFGFVEDFIEKSGEIINISIGRLPKKATIQDYRTTLQLLKDYDATQKRKLDFETIDLDFYQDFILWLQTEGRKIKNRKDGKEEKKGFALNTIGKHIKNLKTFLNAATEKGINKNLVFRSKKFKVLKEESENVYLSTVELDKIYNLDLSNNPKLDKARDLFLIGAWTGLRFSDFTNIKPEDIQNDLISIRQKKTHNKVSIPVDDVVKQIIKKYGNQTPPTISNQKLNEYIKEVCKLAEINDKIKTSTTIGGTRETRINKKWELVSTHTARRSFATNAYKSGLGTLTIMAITGHKTETNFMKYIKLTGEDHARILQEHWAKNGRTMRKI